MTALDVHPIAADELLATSLQIALDTGDELLLAQTLRDAGRLGATWNEMASWLTDTYPDPDIDRLLALGA